MSNTAADLDCALNEVRSHYGADRPGQVLQRADSLWEEYGDAADARLGECWRFASISASRNPEMRGTAAVWRARARSAFARSGCNNGVALTMLADFFQAAELYEDQPAVALAVLDAMLATVGGPDEPVSSDLVRDIYFEKRGFLRARLGIAGNDRPLLTLARSDYDLALNLAHVDPRRRLKIRAGRSTVDYLLADSSQAQEVAIYELSSIISDAEGAGEMALDVVGVGRTNLERMRAGSLRLEPYEIL